MSKKSSANRNLLDEDNLCEIIYHILWNKDMFYPSSSLPVYIPDTVIFRSGTPVAWYFSDSEGVMKRKLEANLNIPNIIETFMRKKSKYGIVAYYIYMPETQNTDDISENEDDQKNVIEYFDEEAFRKLLSNPGKLKRGILQRFIDPQGEKNSLIQCVWTKRICLFNRRTNYRLLKDTNSNIYEKCVTFEGPPHMSDTSALKGTALAVKVKEALDFIVNHISNTTFEKFQVSKLVCYLKVDQHNRLWYLFSGFLRSKNKVLYAAVKGENDGLRGTEPLDLNDHIKIPENIHVGPKLGFNSQQVQEKLENCPKCNKISSSSNFVEISYKDIMEAAGKPGLHKEVMEEFDCTPNIGLLLPPQDSPETQDNGQKTYRVRTKQASIPYIIRKMHQKMKPHEFEKIKDEDYFKSKKARVCYNCYFALSKTLNLGGNDQNPSNIKEKDLIVRPTGQTISVNTKLKTTSAANTRNENLSASLPQRYMQRNNSAGSLNIPDSLAGSKRDRTKFIPNHGSLYEKTNSANNTALLKTYSKEDIIKYDPSKPSLIDTKRFQNSKNGINAKNDEDWTNDVNIFDTKSSGGIIKLGSLQRTRIQSLPKVNGLNVPHFSRSSSISKQPNNHTDAIFSLIQSSQDMGSAFPQALLYPEREKNLSSTEELNPYATFRCGDTSDKPYVTHVSQLSLDQYYQSQVADLKRSAVYSGKEDYPLQKEKINSLASQYPDIYNKIMNSHTTDISSDQHLHLQGSMTERTAHDNLKKLFPQKEVEHQTETSQKRLSDNHPNILINSKPHHVKSVSISIKKADKSTFDQSSQNTKGYVKKFVEISPYGKSSSVVKRDLALKKFIQGWESDNKPEPKRSKVIKFVKSVEEKTKIKPDQPMGSEFGVLVGDAQGNWFVNPSQGSRVYEVDMFSLVNSVRDSYKSSLAPSEVYDYRRENPHDLVGITEDKALSTYEENLLTNRIQEGDNNTQKSSDNPQLKQSPKTTESHYQLRLSQKNSKKTLQTREDGREVERFITDLEYSNSQPVKSFLQLKENLTVTADHIEEDLLQNELQGREMVTNKKYEQKTNNKVAHIRRISKDQHQEANSVQFGFKKEDTSIASEDQVSHDLTIEQNKNQMRKNSKQNKLTTESEAEADYVHSHIDSVDELNDKVLIVDQEQIEDTTNN